MILITIFFLKILNQLVFRSYNMLQHCCTFDYLCWYLSFLNCKYMLWVISGSGAASVLKCRLEEHARLF